MIRRLPLVLLLLLLAPTASRADEGVFTATYDFDGEKAMEGIAAKATGQAAQRMPKPKPHQKQLYLLESWMKSSAAIGMPAPTDRRCRTVAGTFTLIMNTGTEGMGFAWADVAGHGTEGEAPELTAWEAPSLEGSFGIGFDASNPPNRDPFSGSGNAYDRPQHEVSLHWDGMEIVKRTTPTEFRDEKPHGVEFRITFVVGGAEVSVALDGTTLFDRYFIPKMLAYVGRPAFGARNEETAGDVLLDDLYFRCADPVGAPPEPTTVTALDHVLNDKKHPKHEADAAFPEDTDAFGRILLTLRLDRPETRFDPWDRLAHVFVYDEDGEPFEILRYITPYHRGHVWTVDVTCFRPLLRGTRRIEQVCGTQGEGWVVSLIFEFHLGPADRYATKVVNLWSGKAILGNPEKPVSDFYVPKTVEVDETTAFAEVRTVVTGHGMSPNLNNAAEFMPIERTLTVNGHEHVNRLWKEDNYLNPCRPQGGTWKYDRAGWAPGDVVRPWVVDVSDLLVDGTLEITYALAPYVNANRGKTWEPYHRTESFVILYRRP